MKPHFRQIHHGKFSDSNAFDLDLMRMYQNHWVTEILLWMCITKYITVIQNLYLPPTPPHLILSKLSSLTKASASAFSASRLCWSIFWANTGRPVGLIGGRSVRRGELVTPYADRLIGP